MNNLSNKKLLVIDVAGLGYRFFRRHHSPEWKNLVFHPIESTFPALTCTVQAGFRTALPPGDHGMISNGVFMRELSRPLFWEQSANLVQGRRIWDSFRRQGKRVGMMFWQQSLGEEVDVILSPAPIHKHGGGMIDDCYSKPAGLYAGLCRDVGQPFKLGRYWGPLASVKAGEWITSATVALLRDAELAPELLLTYLPTLDYDLQRYGPESRRGEKALRITLAQLERLISAAGQAGYETIIFGDYEISTVTKGAVLPNLALAEAGLMKRRQVKQAAYPDLYSSSAFAMADHEVAHVYIKNPADIEPAEKVLTALPGVEAVLDKEKQKHMRLDHRYAGELVLTAEEGYWFAYPWWRNKKRAPDYAGHVDIHNKPGFDPCELFFGWPPWRVCQNNNRIRGTHGRAGKNRLVCYATSFSFMDQPTTIIDLANVVKAWLEEDL